ncbi:MAG: DMT family transporter [Myxococcota bacterium]
MDPRVLAVGQGLGVIIVSQLMGVLAKLALFEVDAFTFVWLQVGAALAALAFHTFVWRRQAWPRGLDARVWLGIAFVGAINFGLCRVWMMLGIQRLPMNTFVFVLSFIPLVTLALSIAFLRERPGFVQVVGLLLAIVGVWLYFPVLPPPEERSGLVYAGLVVLGLGASNNVTRYVLGHASTTLSPALYSTIGLMIGGLPIVLVGLFTDGARLVDGPDAFGGVRILAIILANGVLGIALSQTVFNGILRTLRSFEASVVANSGLVWTALWAIPILGEWLSPARVGAIAVLMTGVLATQWRPADER